MSDDEDNLWDGWESGPSTMDPATLPKEVPMCKGKGSAKLELGHLAEPVDIHSMTGMANGNVAFPDDPTQMPVAELPPVSGRSKKPRRGRVVLVDEDGSGAIRAVPLNPEQDKEIVQAIAGDKYNQAAFLKAMRGAPTPQGAVEQLADEELREKFKRAGNIIFSADTVAALKPPRKRPAQKKSAAEVTESPAPAAKKRKAEAPAPEPAKPAPKPAKQTQAPEPPEPPSKKIKVTVTAEVASMEEFAGLFRS